ncbi:MAG TPA: HDIG domain-containing protein [Bacteroidales bacterium]|jgi:putative nucleotidyltransferase with HDIG domain|nr:HDIG domain-containing protein [Bacteroidales bacterium]HPB88883.1 HDIG domain-containing protein [Bacteroidales bacterium]HPY21164.1 HDIG domain-containing protein [Bacteroidales bacterium]HQA92409.1 HDIG domain-containing protein [Bacteroidales bacterium]HQN23432.1 HDIG domain-containing protein [Bacteroidales bacterium]
METTRNLKNYRSLIWFGVLALLMILLYPVEGKFKYEYARGQAWIYETLIAPIDFPILKTEAEMLVEIEQKTSRIIEYYNYNDETGERMIDGFIRFSIDKSIPKDISRHISEFLTDAYYGGIVSTFEDDISDKVIFVNRNGRVTDMPALEVYDQKRAAGLLQADLRYTFPKVATDSLITLLNIPSWIVPNLEYDENVTALLHRDAVNYISPTKGIIYSGQLIVSKGEIVSAEIEQILDSYKAEYSRSFGYSSSRGWLILSHILTVLMLVALLYLAIFFTSKEVLRRTGHLLYILLMAFFSFAATALVHRLGANLIYLVPFAALVLIAASFFRNELIFPVYVISLLPLLLIAENGIELFGINLVAGSIGLLTYAHFNRGWKLFLNAVFIFAGMMILLLSFRLLTDDAAMIWKSYTVTFLAINAVLCVVLNPFVLLFEKIFSFTSYSRLFDLTDSSNPLLQELSHRAPGTFQHSLMVANMAENAAREIGANAMLARAGAMYHDVGKIENPACFIENTNPGSGQDNYHKGLTPEESAADIIRHVDDGLALARKFHLPDVIKDFIRSHHGQSMTLYFYNVYCNNGGDPKNTAPFTYRGMLPTTKEQVIVMMADAVEAASRSLKKYTDESISELVEEILGSRLSDQQLVRADISLKEINTVKECFKRQIKQTYHARIAYPKRKRDSKQ